MGLINYLKQTQAEMNHINWPTRKQATAYTVIVIIISILTAIYLGAFDALFAYILEQIIANNF